MEINCMASTERQRGGGRLIPLSKFSEKIFSLDTTTTCRSKQQSWLKGIAYHGSYSGLAKHSPDTPAKRLQKLPVPFWPFSHSCNQVLSPLMLFPLAHKDVCAATAEIRQALCALWLLKRWSPCFACAPPLHGTGRAEFKVLRRAETWTKARVVPQKANGSVHECILVTASLYIICRASLKSKTQTKTFMPNISKEEQPL